MKLEGVLIQVLGLVALIRERTGNKLRNFGKSLCYNRLIY